MPPTTLVFLRVPRHHLAQLPMPFLAVCFDGLDSPGCGFEGVGLVCGIRAWVRVHCVYRLAGFEGRPTASVARGGTAASWYKLSDQYMKWVFLGDAPFFSLIVKNIVRAYGFYDFFDPLELQVQMNRQQTKGYELFADWTWSRFCSFGYRCIKLSPFGSKSELNARYIRFLITGRSLGTGDSDDTLVFDSNSAGDSVLARFLPLKIFVKIGSERRLWLRGHTLQSL